MTAESVLSDRVARALDRHAPRAGATTGGLRAALADAAAQRGRSVRAGLLLASAEVAKVPADAADRLACAVEFWHLASLLLDDLPCMDDATERRGQPCLHRVHGEANTILTALALINRAYTLVGEAFASRPETVRRAALAAVERVMGPQGILGGQSADLGFARSDRSAAEVGRIAWRKTGALLSLGLLLPALWGGGTPARCRDLRRLAVYWGLAYQAMDDLSDLLLAEQSGKTAHRDAALGRPNLVLALGVPGAKRRIARLVAGAQFVMQRLAAEEPRLAFLRQWHDAVFAVRAARQAA